MGNWSKDDGGIRQRLKELKEEGQLEGFEAEANKVEGLLISPDNIHVAIDALEQLEERIKRKDAAHQKELAPYRHKLEIWTKQGFDTTGLSMMLVEQDANLKKVDAVFWRFEKMVERVVNMEKVLFEISIPEFETEVESLRDLMTDPARLGEVARRYHHLVQRINGFKKEQQRRIELAQVIEKYKGLGYKVDTVMKASEGDVKTLEMAVSELEDHVVILQDLEERLQRLQQSAKPERIEYIRSMLKDPDRINIAMDEVDRLEKRR